jgi:hypothetical protein
MTVKPSHIFPVLFLLAISAFAFSQKLDTVKAYNVHCTFSEGSSISAWGGNFTSYYPSEPCPEKSKQKYISNHKKVSQYMSSKKFFWMKLYNLDDKLIYEGLQYSDCSVGPFICYWPNGQFRVKGQYSGYTYSPKKGYKLEKCGGEKTGKWEFFNEEGKSTKVEEY